MSLDDFYEQVAEGGIYRRFVEQASSFFPDIDDADSRFERTSSVAYAQYMVDMIIQDDDEEPLIDANDIDDNTMIVRLDLTRKRDGFVRSLVLVHTGRGWVLAYAREDIHPPEISPVTDVQLFIRDIIDAGIARHDHDHLDDIINDMDLYTVDIRVYNDE